MDIFSLSAAVVNELFDQKMTVRLNITGATATLSYGVQLTRRKIYMKAVCKHVVFFLFVFLGLAFFGWAGGQRVTAQTDIVNIPVGQVPVRAAINPQTNKIYVTNRQSNNVTVIDGTNNSTVTVAAGWGAFVVAVNTLTNKIYVANQFNNTVTVIDGTNNSTATITTGDSPNAIAVNPLTNKIYVANQSSDDVTIINGADNSTTTVNVGNDPRSVAVNPVTNKIYVSARDGNTMTVIDGANNSTATVTVSFGTEMVAVNPVTNKIYAAGSIFFTAIDGATNSTTTFFFGSPTAMTVNSMTDRVYVVDSYGELAIINGADNSMARINIAAPARTIALNQATNKIYVPDRTLNAPSLTIIDGATNATTAAATGAEQDAVVVNPVTNKIYVVNSAENNVTVIEGASDPATAFTIGGRIGAGNGRGIPNASVFLLDAHGRIHAARTNTFGFYRFNNIPFGAVIVGASAKNRTFAAPRRAVNVAGDLDDLNFMALDD